MNKIAPVNNPFSMFKMVDTSAVNVTVNNNPAVSTPSANLKSINKDVVDLNNKSQSEKSNKFKKIDPKILAAGGAVIAIVAGAIYAIKSHKLPFLKGKNLDDATKTVSKVVEDIPQAVEQVAQEAQQTDRTKEIGFAVAAFSAGLIARALKEIKNSDDAKAIELKKQVLQREFYLRNVEIPYLEKEASEYYRNYKQDILNAIENFDRKKDKIGTKYAQAVVLYNGLKEGSYEENWPNSNLIKLKVERNPKNNTTRVETFSQDNKSSVAVYYNSLGKPLLIEQYYDGKLRLKGSFRHTDNDEGYLSKIFIYTKGSKKASLISYDKNGNPEFYLARNNDGKLIKSFEIDNKTLDVKTIILPDNSGKSWLKWYEYDANGNLKTVLAKPSNGLPQRRYNFDNGVVKSLDLFNDMDKTPILHVPFEEESN